MAAEAAAATAGRSRTRLDNKASKRSSLFLLLWPQVDAEGSEEVGELRWPPSISAIHPSLHFDQHFQVYILQP